jgi:DNA-binding GntR family transcriptional regulator
VTLKDARDLLATRTLLEGEAARLAAEANVDADRLRRLESLCKKSYKPSSPASIAAFLEANTAFHATVADMSGNQVLADVLRGVLERLERLFHLGLVVTSRQVEVVHAHTELVEAILQGDGDAAERVAVEQARASQAMVLNALLASDAVLWTSSTPTARRAARR